MECKDDLLKNFVFNKRIASVAAGSAGQSWFFLNNLKKLTDRETTIDQIYALIENNAEKIITKYVNTTGKYQKSAFIFTGFNLKNGKQINSSKLGQILSAPAMKREGNRINQHIHPKITEALTREIFRRKGLKKDEIIEVDFPDSKLFSLKINSFPHEKHFELQQVDCYDYAIFYPKSLEETALEIVSIPKETISEIEFPQNYIGKGEDVVYNNSAMLMALVQNIIKDKKFITVGGNIFTLMVTPEGSIFPTGSVAKIEDGKVIPIGSIKAIKGKIGYEFSDGRKGLYRTIGMVAKSDMQI